MEGTATLAMAVRRPCAHAQLARVRVRASRRRGTPSRRASCASCVLAAPLMWGRAGGNAELLGAPYLSVVHVVSDAAVLLIFLTFLCRLQVEGPQPDEAATLWDPTQMRLPPYGTPTR